MTQIYPSCYFTKFFSFCCCCCTMLCIIFCLFPSLHLPRLPHILALLLLTSSSTFPSSNPFSDPSSHLLLTSWGVMYPSPAIVLLLQCPAVLLHPLTIDELPFQAVPASDVPVCLLCSPVLHPCCSISLPC